MSNLPDPITRTEQYFNAIANGETEVPEPITREEIYLNAIAQNGGGGGGGGTTNYNQLSNKPQIGGTTLQGDKSLADLGIASNAVMTGATSEANGAKGLVPAPQIADKGKYLKGDGTWGTPEGGGGTSDYTDLTNKPQINGHTLTGNQSAADLGIQGNVQGDWNENDTEDPAYIKNKPAIPAAQIQSDWNQSDTDAKDFIKNKPAIPAAQVNVDWNASGGVAEILNKPTIPAEQVNADWESSSGKSEILHKPTIPGAMSASDLQDIEEAFDVAQAHKASSFIEYSTNEQVIGRWIDGRPLYQKTVSCGAMPNNTTKQVAHEISDIREVIDITGAFNNGTNFFDLPNPMASGNYAKANVNKTYIEIETKSNLSAYTYCYVTLRYTKTTDTV